MAKYLRYIIRNIEPLRIADDSVSQRGQTATLQYIPGSTIRGLVINALAADSKFSLMKKKLFSSSVRFLNAYPLAEWKTGNGRIETKELIPSPKGFYERKGGLDEQKTKAIENSIANEKFSEYGLKKADVGRYCYIEDGCIHYYLVKTGSDMKIKINCEENEKQDIFRNEYIMPGHCFAGYIAIDLATDEKSEGSVTTAGDEAGSAVSMEELTDKIRDIFSGQIILGNGRSAGMGKCTVEECSDCETIPYSAYQEEQPVSGKCYMMLLSNAVMRDENGEYCGLNVYALAKHLGVEKLEIEQCASSAVDVKGFNRKWKCKIPSVLMFEQGSVFRLSFKGELTGENITKLMDRGIGVRRNEGFGRVIFLKGYDQIHKKQEKSLNLKSTSAEECLELDEDDRKVLQIAAKCYYRNRIEQAICQYIVNNPLETGGIADSQIGQVLALAVSYQYEPGKAFYEINKLFFHAAEKEEKYNIQKERYSMGVFSKFVRDILDKELALTLGVKTKNPDHIMGIAKTELLNKEEADTLKLHLLSSWIRFYNKQEKKEEQDGVCMEV